MILQVVGYYSQGGSRKILDGESVYGQIGFS